MLERDDELDRLGALIASARRGEGAIAVVEGPPGIGKTTLLAAAGREAVAAGITRLRARGDELERTFPFGVVLQLLDPVLRHADEREQAELFSGAAGLVRRLFEPGSAAAPGPDPDFATLYGLYWLLAGISERSPLLLVIDDVHWADAPTRRLLAFLGRRLEGLPMAVIVATRPDLPAADGGAIAELVADVSDVIRPGPLSHAAIAGMLRHELNAADPALVEACHRMTGGNPFYLRALVNELGRPGAVVAPAAVERLSPRAVSRALLRRLATLPPACGRVTAAVAVLGDGTSARDAADLVDLEIEVTDRAIAALTAADVFAPGDELAFAHPIARAAAYADLHGGERARLHARAARIRLGAGAPPDRVAAHLLRAAPGALTESVPVLVAAARGATDAGAPEIAATYLRRALLEPLDDERRAELSAALGRASARAGLPEAEAELRVAMERAPTASRRAGVGLDLARLLGVRGSAEAIDVLVVCARACASSDPGLANRLKAEILAIGDADLSFRALALAQAEALGPIDDEQDDVTAAKLLAHAATDAIMRCAPASEVSALDERALAGGALVHAGVAGVQLSFLCAYFLMCADRFDEAERHLDGALAAARGAGSAAGFASASAWRSSVALRRGELGLADAHARASLDTARSITFASSRRRP